MPWTMEQRYVNCGKESCGKCRPGHGSHGPYWYGYERAQGRLRSKYFGKHRPSDDVVRRGYVTPHTDPPKEQPAPAEHERVPVRFIRGKRMDYATALRIIGFDRTPSTLVLQMRYRELMMKWHPDHGGSTYVATSINLAYQYLAV